jgi:sporulation integral membrane protein YtvI
MAALPHAVLFCVTTVLAVFFALASYPAVTSFLRRQFSPARWSRLRGVRDTLFSTLGRWLRAQCILVLVTFAQLLAGFLLLRQPYAVLLAALIALIDALPVLGTGTVLLPWAALLLLAGNVPRAVALAALYAVAALVRSSLEPRIMAAQAGLPPLAALAAMYVGFRTLGVGGMVLLPVLLLLVKRLHDAGYIKIWK